MPYAKPDPTLVLNDANFLDPLKTYLDGLESKVNGVETAAQIAPGALIIVRKGSTAWPTTGTPVRPTDRADVVVAWLGPDPSPPVVATGTGGMRDNLDVRWVTP